MNVTAYELKTHCGEIIDRAAAGEEIVITKRGIAKVKMVPVEYFDRQKQAQVLANMAKIRREFAQEGKWFTREDIKGAIEERAPLMFVADASVVLDWMLPGPLSTSAEAAWAMAQREYLVVPALWLWETQNVILTHIRRKTLTPQRAVEIRTELSLLSKRIDESPDERTLGRIWQIAADQMATFYDASYVELALRLGLPLASTDRGVRHAATGMGVTLI